MESHCPRVPDAKHRPDSGWVAKKLETGDFSCYSQGALNCEQECSMLLFSFSKGGHTKVLCEKD